AVRHESIERQRGQGLAPPAPEAARAIVRAHPRNRADVRVGEPAQEPAAPWPVYDGAARDVSRSDDEIGVARRGDERRKAGGVVRKISVHLADDVHVLTDRVLDSIDVRSAEP